MPLLNRTPEGDALRRDYFARVLDPARAAFAKGDSIGGLRVFLSGEGFVATAGTNLLAHAFELRREMLANREQYMPPLACADLGALHTGVLLVSGDRSPSVFHAITAELARCLQNDSSVTIPNAGHAMHASNPAYYNQVVLRYLATH